MLSQDTREEIERRALEITAALDARDGRYAAELIPNADPCWHVVATAPGAEGKAMEYLSDRGFGVYLPRFETTHVVRGKKRVRWHVLFPRHLFAFVWDVKAHWRRIRACPGVSAILVINEVPVVVPDAAIARMQLIELSGAVPSIAKGKRKWRRTPLAAAEAGDGDVFTIRCKSYWVDELHGVTELDERGRIGVLHRALGLSSRSGPIGQDSAL